MDEQQLLLLIAHIYDASLDLSRWPAVLEKTCQFVHGVASVWTSQDCKHKSAELHFSWGDDPEYARSYRDTYVKINPLLLPMMRRSEPGAVIAHSELIPFEQFLMSRFYKEWTKPQGYLDAISATLDKSTTGFAALTVARHERDGVVDAEMRRRMELLAPHFCRAAAIGKVIEKQKVESAMLSDTLDGLAAAMFLVDTDARIVHANASGYALLADGGVVKSRLGRLAGPDCGFDRTLRDVCVAADAGDAAVGTKGMAMPLIARDGERWVAHALALTSGGRRQAGIFYSAVAAVFVCKVSLDLPFPLETIGDLFGLTPAELRVLTAIVDIGGVPDVAPVLGISERTVKTHLQRIFEKTGTNRQAGLVKLVAGFLNPLGVHSHS